MVFKEYVYDFRNYYHQNKNGELTIITQKEYIEKTGESVKIINDLKNSYGPGQVNDYFLMKPPFPLENIGWATEKIKLENIVNHFDMIILSKIKEGYYGLEFINEKDKNIFSDLFKDLIKVENKFTKSYPSKIIYVYIKNPDNSNWDSRTFYFNEKVKKIIYKRLNIPLEKKIVSNPNGLIPIDWLLSNLTKYFWDIGLITTGLNQPSPGYITFENKTENGKKTFEVLKELFGEKKNLKINFNEKYNYTHMQFDYKTVLWMHKKLKIKLPDHSKALDGGRMEFIKDSY